MSVEEMEGLERDGDYYTLADGTEVMRDFRAEHAPRHAGADLYPLFSDAMGVHPAQIPEMRRLARQRGVPTEFTKDGRAVLTSRGHRKDFGEAFGFFDKDGGYGDPQRR